MSTKRKGDGDKSGSNQPPKDDAVGYGRPPVEHQFKPGNNANPGGRKKGSLNLKTIAKKELYRKLVVTVRGKKTTMTVAEIALRRLGDNAMNGNEKSFAALATTAGETQGTNEVVGSHLVSPEHDKAILDNYYNRRKPGK